MKNTLVLIFILFTVQAQIIGSFKPIINYTQPLRCRSEKFCYCNHFVYALDQSGSMSGSNWDSLISTMDGVPAQLGFNGGRNFMTTYEFNETAHPPNFFHRYPTQFHTGILNMDGGLTSFNSALNRAVIIINGYLRENTCFFLITDGFSSWSSTVVNMFNAAMQKIRKNGCKTCAYCYFIKKFPNMTIPPQFINLCSQINAIMRTVTDDQLPNAVITDQKAAVNKLQQKSSA